ncbi:MAG: phosphate ABC transporter substrate-binding protein [Myxococcota bacterium]|nr:phosphate ABC transporter substrate-binding protein [Myxococcota bacterium]
MHRIASSSLIAAFLVVSLAACSGGNRDRGQGAEGAGGRVSVKGSDTMVVLSQRWAEGYMQSHPGTTIQVSGGGTGTGIASLINGTADVANASRPLTERERQQLGTESAPATETRVALDALAIYVHDSNPIRTLTIPQLSEIYRGRITNWSAVGGPDRPIVLYSRENNSGTYAYFKEHVLDGADFAPNAQTLPGTAAVINAVARDPGGIGYGGIGYGTGVRTLPISNEGGELIEPTMENATSGRYPLARYLFMVTRGEPQGATGEFIEWIRSAPGQALVSEVGFYPLPAEGAGPAQ